VLAEDRLRANVAWSYTAGSHPLLAPFQVSTCDPVSPAPSEASGVSSNERTAEQHNAPRLHVDHLSDGTPRREAARRSNTCTRIHDSGRQTIRCLLINKGATQMSDRFVSHLKPLIPWSLQLHWSQPKAFHAESCRLCCQEYVLENI
jgi:hypothetical protein